jgi:hypothetical protein
MRPTSLARQEIINKFKPRDEANKAVRDLLARDADEFVEKMFHKDCGSVVPPPSFASHLVRDVLLPMQEYEKEIGQQRGPGTSSSGDEKPLLPTAALNGVRTFGPLEVLHIGSTGPRPGIVASVAPFRSTPVRGSNPGASAADLGSLSGSGPADDEYFSLADEAAMRSPVKTAAPSMAETKLPEHNLVSYVDYFTEQQILREQQEIHREAYEAAKQLYADECRFVKSCITSMAEGRFLDVHEGAVGTRPVPVVELSKMRLQRDSVPVMFVAHDDDSPSS